MGVMPVPIGEGILQGKSRFADYPGKYFQELIGNRCKKIMCGDVIGKLKYGSCGIPIN